MAIGQYCSLACHVMIFDSWAALISAASTNSKGSSASRKSLWTLLAVVLFLSRVIRLLAR
jgi:hypothetical protein